MGSTVLEMVDRPMLLMNIWRDIIGSFKAFDTEHHYISLKKLYNQGVRVHLF